MFTEIKLDERPDDKALQEIEKVRRRKELNKKLDKLEEQMLIELACIPIIAAVLGIIAFVCVWLTC